MVQKVYHKKNKNRDNTFRRVNAQYKRSDIIFDFAKEQSVYLDLRPCRICWSQEFIMSIGWLSPIVNENCNIQWLCKQIYIKVKVVSLETRHRWMWSECGERKEGIVMMMLMLSEADNPNQALMDIFGGWCSLKFFALHQYPDSRLSHNSV